MITYWPDYYREFKCKAGSCQHTCCSGWVIGIDEKSMERFGKEPDIVSKITDCRFDMGEDGRCPFLRDDNLCEMIIDYGEDFLCDICREHPRFYNGVDGHIEAGVGLVCEAACDLVLDAEKHFALEGEDGSVLELPSYIKDVFDESMPLTLRLTKIANNRRASSKLRAEIFDEMETLDPLWDELTAKIIADPVTEEAEDELINNNAKAFANFAAYLQYRYRGFGRFSAEACYFVADIVLKGLPFKDAVRMFSGEVEYSDVNIDSALEIFE